jgi:hypothetical protein
MAVRGAHTTPAGAFGKKKRKKNKRKKYELV